MLAAKIYTCILYCNVEMPMKRDGMDYENIIFIVHTLPDGSDWTRSKHTCCIV